MNSTEPRRRKSASTKNTASNDDGDIKRKRGRPRMLFTDEKFAERRRTQIRVAQRAYRSRKEAKITDLSERLAEIDVSIQEMNESFCAFRNELTRSGLLLQQHPKLRQSFQRLVEKSDALAAFSSGSDRCSSSKTPSDADPEGVETASPSFLLDGLGAVGSDDLTSAMGEMPNEFNALYASTTNNAPFGEEPLLQAPYHDAGIQMTASSSSPSLRFQNQNQNQYSLPQDLPLPSTYSFQESSFVRRLRRRCLEEGYCLLSDTRRDPGRIAHIFRFSLGFRNRETVRARYATALSRSDIENVDSGTRNGNNSDNYRQVAIPLNYHVGNAGTHFPPSRGTSPNSFPSISSTSENQMQPVSEFIGPWSFHFADPPHDKTSIEELLVSNDMAGEWFNATDVDGYLRQMGILIDGHSTFVTVPAKNVQSQPASHMQTDPFLDLSTATSTSANANANAMLQRAPFDLGTNMDVDLNLDVDLDLDLLTPLMTSQSASQPDYPFNMTQTTPLILDVEYFLDRLLTKVVCLGEGSGYRKQDIDDSLRVACYPMF